MPGVSVNVYTDMVIFLNQPQQYDSALLRQTLLFSSWYSEVIPLQTNVDLSITPPDVSVWGQFIKVLGPLSTDIDVTGLT